MNRKQKMFKSNIAIFCFFVLALIFLVFKVSSNQVINVSSGGSESLVFGAISVLVILLFIISTFYLPMLFVVKFDLYVELKEISMDIINVYKNIHSEYKTSISINSKKCVCRC